MFTDRREAGRALARRLLERAPEMPVVLALPRGGVPVALEIAVALKAPLDLMLVRKIGVPWQPELAAGAVADGPAPITFFNRAVLFEVGLTEQDFAEDVQAKLAEIERRRKLWLGGREPVALEGRSVILVDDGVATGATTRVALRAIRQRHPRRLILAVPVGPKDSLEELAQEADEVICLETPPGFGAISQFYLSFPQLTDEDVTAVLRRAAAEGQPPAPSAPGPEKS